MAKRVGVLMGGLSGEREVSLRTGEGVAAALEARGHEIVRIVIGPETAPVDLLVRQARIDVAFLALHGRGGEDGCVQGLLEWMGIPYTGSSVIGSALAMDKVKAKELFRLHNVPTPPYYVAAARDLSDLAELHASFGFPVVVKPRGEGSSLGVSKASTPAELQEAVRAALTFDETVLVERFVRGMEVHVGVLDGRVLGAIEVVPKSGVYDYHSKYTSGATDYVCPPRLSATRVGGVVNLAERAVRALGCSGAVRVDLLVTEGENEYVLEVNTLPGMTPTSLLPQIAAAAGLDYGALCEAILAGARLHAAIPRPSDQRGRVVPLHETVQAKSFYPERRSGPRVARY
ncbi:MAG TPA: D-alanine--D-alanine ligase [Polyangiaceae bacterium]|nr:D-alanine--D-alanine ligase [Polyangiaceae bacterium]